MARPKGDTTQKKYKAPALEKGLEILEVLARSDSAMSTGSIAEINGRSVAEIYRMLQVLEAKEYIQQSPTQDGYLLSRKMLQLASESQPIYDLVEYALSQMRTLVETISQSCHLAVVSRERIVVILRAESSSATNFSVRVGYSQVMPKSASGRLLFAMQSAETREKWLEIMKSTNVLSDERDFIKKTDQIRAQGFEKSASYFIDGVTDLATPISDATQAVAALSVPFIHRKNGANSIDQTLEALANTADDITHKIKLGIVDSL